MKSFPNSIGGGLVLPRHFWNFTSGIFMRGWCYTHYDISYVPEGLPEGCSYLIQGFEVCPTTHRPHLQGYMYFPGKKSFAQMQSILPGAHFTAANGNAQQNKAYCSKDGDFMELGTCPQQGKRNDIVVFRDHVRESGGITERECVDSFPTMIARYPKFVNVVNRVYGKARQNPPIVIVFWGPTGTGKSRTSNVLASLLGRCYRVPQAKGSGLYYDGYDNHEVLLFDEFYGNRMSWSSLLEVTDRYPNILPVHGSSGVQNTASYIIFASNKHPSKWYHDIDSSPLRRRIHICYRFAPRKTPQVLERPQQLPMFYVSPLETLFHNKK